MLVEQTRRFREAGLAATPVNGDVYSPQLHKVSVLAFVCAVSLLNCDQDIVARKFRALLTSPEMCLEHPVFAPLLLSPQFMQDVVAMIVDEAHCIPQWRETFRKSFGDLVRLRSAASISTPLLVTSATLTPTMIEDISRGLELDLATTCLINLGNNRANLVPIVHTMKGAASSLSILSFLVRNAKEVSDLRRAIVFFNTRDLAFTAAHFLQGLVPEALQDSITFLHAGRGTRARKIVMQKFRKNEIVILCATEAAGMVSCSCDGFRLL